MPATPVVAVTRQPATFPISDPRLTVGEVDVFSQQTVAGVLAGADAVLSVLGVPFTRRPVDTFSTGTANIVAAMRRNDIRRLIVVSHRHAALPQPEQLVAAAADFRASHRPHHRQDRLRRPAPHGNHRRRQRPGLDDRATLDLDHDHVTDCTAGDVPPVGGCTARIDLAHYLTTLIDDASRVSRSLPIALLFCFASFVGFEATAIYSEEAKDPKRTVPSATFQAVIVIGALHAPQANLPL